MNPAPRCQPMPPEVQDRVGDQLSRPMKCGLSASQRLIEVRPAPRRQPCQKTPLLLRKRPDLPPSAGIHRTELCSEDGGGRRRSVGGRPRGCFVCEQGGDEAVLDAAGVGIVGQVREVEVAEEHSLLVTRRDVQLDEREDRARDLASAAGRVRAVSADLKIWGRASAVPQTVAVQYSTVLCTAGCDGWIFDPLEFRSIVQHHENVIALELHA